MATLHSKIALFLKDRDESLGREDASEEERAASSHKIIDMIDGKFRMNVDHPLLMADGEPDMAEIGKSFMATFEILTMSEGPFKGYTPAEDPTEIVMDLHFALVEALKERKDLADRLRGPAQDAAKRFINHWFKNDGEKPRIGIPARPEYDDDLVLVKALKDAAEALSPKQVLKPLAGEAGAVGPLPSYDAGLLSDYGGGNVEWWQDYVRLQLAQAHEFYFDQWNASLTPPKAETERVAEPPQEERNDYISDAQARAMFIDPDDDEPVMEDRIRVCAGEWVKIPGGYYFDASAGLLHPETAPAETASERDDPWQTLDSAPAAKLYESDETPLVLLCNEHKGPVIGYVNERRDGSRRGIVGGWHGTVWTHWARMPARTALSTETGR